MIRLGFIGGGNMAQALMQGLIARRVFRADQMVASDIDPARRRRLSRATKARAVAANREVVEAAPAIVLAVKPQTIGAVMDEIGPLLAKKTGPRKLFISIAAGVAIATLEAGLPGSRVIRVMPNAPAMVGEGMAAIVRGRLATAADQAFALKLFSAVGQAVVLKEERLLDGVTALSGSGPAYVYLFVQALAEAGVKEGLPPQTALMMARQTVRGAVTQMERSRMTPQELIAIVASPGGTTEAALGKFAELDFGQTVASAVFAAAARSRELGRSR